MKGLTDIAGIRVGHASDYDALTGCTVITCEQGAVAGVDVRGSATGTEELLVMSPYHITGMVHAVVLSGGSAFGLESASGVRRYLEHKGVGFDTGAARVPIVPCAILYDLGIGKKHVRPTREMGEAAAAAAHSGPIEEGAVGAGTGATVGKLFGLERAMKSGVGSATVTLGNGVLVSALAAVNAFGDVIDPGSGRIVAGARTAPNSHAFVNTSLALKEGAGKAPFPLQHTTLGVIATNARLNKVGANKLAELASIGVARTVSPVWTMFDGDLTIALSLGSGQADPAALGIAAAEALSAAILRAVRLSPSLGGVPGLNQTRSERPTSER